MGWLFGPNPNNKNLSDAVKLYVDAYVQLRKNTPNGNVNTASINSNLSRAIKVFIDKKRLKVAAKTTEAALNSGVSQNAAVNSGAAAAAAATPSAPPSRVGNAAVEPLPANTPALAVQEIRSAAANQHAANTGQPAPTRAESLLRQAARPPNVVAAPAPRPGFGNRFRALIPRTPTTGSVGVKVNGVIRNYNLNKRKFSSPSVPDIYTVKPSRFGGYIANVNSNKFRAWAANKNLNTLTKLPNSVKRRIPNFSKILVNKTPRTNTSGANFGAAIRQARGPVPNQIVSNVTAPNKLNINSARRILANVTNLNKVANAGAKFNKFNKNIISQLNPKNEFQLAAVRLKLGKNWNPNGNSPIRNALRNTLYKNGQLNKTAVLFARRFPNKAALKRVLNNPAGLNNKQLTLLRAAIGPNNATPLNSLVSHRLENN